MLSASTAGPGSGRTARPDRRSAGDDQNITAEDNAAFERALQAAGIEHELVTYEGAPHSFFDRKQEQFAAASDDAWQRVLSFVETHTG